MNSVVGWPERLTLRDTQVYADEGQRIFTTATGHGYERCEYVRADLIAAQAAEIERLTKEREHLRNSRDQLHVECSGHIAARETATRLLAEATGALAAIAGLGPWPDNDLGFIGLARTTLSNIRGHNG